MFVEASLSLCLLHYFRGRGLFSDDQCRVHKTLLVFLPLRLLFPPAKTKTSVFIGSDEMTRKRSAGRKPGTLAREIEDLAKKIDLMRVDERKKVKELENTIQQLEGQLKEERRERDVLRKTRFVMKHDFKNVLDMVQDQEDDGPTEEHFGIDWNILVEQDEDHIGVFLKCEPRTDDKTWTVKIQEEVLMMLGKRIIKMEKGESLFYHSDGSSMGYWQFISLDELKNEMKECPDCPVSVEYRVVIMDSKGMPNQEIQKYVAPISNLTDVVLKVEDRKFHVSRQCLANHCDYFRTLFYEDFAEKGKAEVTLGGIDPFDFQNFLDVVYGDLSIDETNVEGILVIADMYKAEKSIAHCERFLIHESEKVLKKKYDMSIRFRMAKLTKLCISKITDMKMYEKLVTDNLDSVEAWVAHALIRRSIELNMAINSKT